VLTYDRDRVLRLWHAGDHRLLQTYDRERQPVPRATLIRLSQTRAFPSFHPGGTMIAAPMGNRVQLLDGHTLDPIHTFEGHGDIVTAAIISPDGRHLVTTSRDGTARVWSMASRRQLRVLDGGGPLACADVSRDGRVATAGSGSDVVIWDLESGKRLTTLEGHSAVVLGLAFERGGERLATISPDTTIRIWDVHSGRARVVIEAMVPAFGVAFSPDGKLVASTDGTGRASVWDAERGLLLNRLGSMAEFGYSITFDPDGGRIALSNGRGELWDVASDSRPQDRILQILDDRLPYVLSGDRPLPKSSVALGVRR